MDTEERIYNKRTVIVCLTLMAVGLIEFIVTVTDKEKQLEKAVAVIEQVRQDEPEYFYDVLVSGDTYQEYSNNK